MSNSHRLFIKDSFELSIEEHSNKYDLCMGTCFEEFGKPTVLVEIPDLTPRQLEDLGIKVMEVLSYYHPNPPQVIQRLLRELPEYKERKL